MNVHVPRNYLAAPLRRYIRDPYRPGRAAVEPWPRSAVITGSDQFLMRRGGETASPTFLGKLILRI